MYLELAENNENFPYVFVPLRDGDGIFVHRDKLNETLSANIFKKIGKGIKNIGKEAGKAVKKYGLSVPRNAFLGMLELNVHGFATKLQKALDKGKEAQMEKMWKALGGQFSKLKSAIAHGAKKKALAEYETLSVAPAAAAAAGTATPVIITVLNFLKQHAPEIIDNAKDVVDLVNKIKAEHGGELPPDPTSSEGKQVYDKESHIEDKTVGGVFGIPTPVLIGGLALVAFLMLRKK